MGAQPYYVVIVGKFKINLQCEWLSAVFTSEYAILRE